VTLRFSIFLAVPLALGAWHLATPAPRTPLRRAAILLATLVLLGLVPTLLGGRFYDRDCNLSHEARRELVTWTEAAAVLLAICLCRVGLRLFAEGARAQRIFGGALIAGAPIIVTINVVALFLGHFCDNT
jgi:hypothetical protein